MRCNRIFSITLALLIFGFFAANSAQAGIATTGNVDPADPATWDSSTMGYVGKTADGSMTIDLGSDVIDKYGSVGFGSGVSATATVTGAGSTWTNSHNFNVGHKAGSSGTVNVISGGAISCDRFLYVGFEGSGTLNISSGGAVTAGEHTYVAVNAGSSGTINFNNGTLTTNGLLADSADLSGTGTINATGLVSNVALVFDSTHGLNQSFNINENVTVNLNLDGSGRMGAGYNGVGTLSISDGIVVESTGGYLGYHSGSNGTATVTGSGSTWTNSGISVGHWGAGTLNITAGGAVSSGYSTIASISGSNGTATVTGSGSTWTNSDGLRVGNHGSGTLNITDGGAVTVGEDTWVSYSVGSSGTINFNNGTLTTGGLLAAVADLTGTGTIYTTALVSDVDLVFDSSNGLNQTFSMNNPGQNITVNLNVDGANPMGAGYGGVGTMSISDGIVIESTEGYLGYKSGSSGTATVTGPGSAWNNTYSLVVGRYGSGTLNITDGGAVSSRHSSIATISGSTGTVTVDGVGSTWTNSDNFYVGSRGSGTLNITDGGAVSSRHSYIGNQSGSTGTAAVDGVGSTWTASDNFYVGNYGSGTLNITDGGAVSSRYSYIGRISGSTGTVTVDGVGSTWTVSDDFYVGSSGSGTLNITDGGAVNNGLSTYIGYRSGSTGTVTVDGVGSTLTESNNLYVGRSGTGTLNIKNGGAVTVAGDLSINNLGTLDILLASTSDPLLDVAGNATIDGSLAVALAEGFALNQGDLFTLIDMTNSASTLTGTFIGLGEDESVGNFGGLDLFISYVGGDGNDVTLYSILDLDIDIRPGNEQNPVNLNSNGVLPVALFGETDFDVYNIDLSSLSLEGAVPKQRGNSPKVGSYKDINGDDLIDLLVHFDLAELDVDGSATELVLEGELNNGMAFNTSDAIRLVGPGDVNADGFVDGVDFGTWQANYPTNVTPEPATLGLLLLGGLALLRRRLVRR